MTRVSRIRIAAASAAFAIVAAILLGTGSRDHQRLAAAREQNTRLAATAHELGIPVDALTNSAFASAAPRETTRRPGREDASARDARLHDFAGRVAAVLAELEAIRRDGKPGDVEFQKRLHGLIYELQGMVPDDLRALAAIFDTHPAIAEENRANLVTFSIRTLANRNPQAALAIALDPASPLREENHRQSVIGHALGQWAADKPMAAMQWFEQHAGAIGENQDMRNQLLGGIARQDPALAFEMMAGLGVSDAAVAADAIVGHAGDADRRDQVLAAMRAHLAQPPSDPRAAAELRGNVVANLAVQSSRDGAPAAIRWIENAKLTPEELTAVAGRANQLSLSGDRTTWLDWFVTLDHPEAQEISVREVLRSWTPEDPASAEAWVVRQPQGNARDAALEVLATTIAPHDPARAIRHAADLPPGTARDHHIEHVLGQWRSHDPEAAAAYARQHGLNP